MQSDDQTQTSSDFPFLHNRTQTPPKCFFQTTKRILQPSRLINEPGALHSDFYPLVIVLLVKKRESLHSDFYLFEIILYPKKKRPTSLQLKNHTRNINTLVIEKSFVQPQHQCPCN